MTKRVVWAAKSEAEKDKFADIGPNGDGIFRLCKQLDHENQDVVGEKCVRNNKGELSLSNVEKMKVWVEHYVRLLNVEFEWPSDSLPEVAPVAGPPPGVSKELVRKALSRMKSGKAAGPSGVLAEGCWGGGD